ncbi:MAG: transposase, partial [Gemmataceae bacterium]|nr:transposase [Gemmataceae bacterium]
MTRLQLTTAQRQDLLDHYRRSNDPDVQHRAHLLLLLADGHPWATIRTVLFCSLGTISRWKARFEADGVDAVFGRPRGRRRSGVQIWAAL